MKIKGKKTFREKRSLVQKEKKKMVRDQKRGVR